MLVVMESRFDPAKDAANLQKHKLPLIFGDRIFEDDSLKEQTVRIGRNETLTLLLFHDGRMLEETDTRRAWR